MRSLARIFALLPALMLALTACGEQSQQDTAAEQMEMAMALDRAQLQEAIEAINAQFMEAVRAGDAAAMVDFYTDDATLLPPEAEMVQGLAAVQEAWVALFAEGGFTLNLSTVSVDGAGEFAYEIGTWSMPTGEAEAGAVEQGKYLVIWKRGATGTWKLHADIWNTSTPAAQ
jgi:uncharacterized protein (TIGR02246 family)